MEDARENKCEDEQEPKEKKKEKKNENMKSMRGENLHDDNLESNPTLSDLVTQF